MRSLLLLGIELWALASWSASGTALAQGTSATYHIEKERIHEEGRPRDRLFISTRMRQGKPTLYVSIEFKITRADGEAATEVLPGEIRVKEDGRPVQELEIQSPRSAEPLTTVLAIDKSGSMTEHGKIAEAKRAATQFLERLHGQARCGLVLFDHDVRRQLMPSRDRSSLVRQVQSVSPGGGTAYLDATSSALAMLRGVRGRRAVVLLTDGVDLNSRHTLQDVIDQARQAETPIYTIGVGEPGSNSPVTTVLVLDKSGSMDEPADESDEMSKMESLHRSASRFVDIMRSGARTTLLPFSDEVDTPEPFSADKERLKSAIGRLKADGQTALFDAAYTAVRLLVTSEPQGKRAVVVLTDGKDNRSRHSADDVIEAGQDAKIPVHMLGLGRRGELDEEVMQRIARQTGGAYHYASSRQRLYEIFESLAIDLNDDGVDEAELKRLAESTGGKYYEARDAARLLGIYDDLAQELQTTYTITFPSLRQDYDGTLRDIDISIWRQGARVSDVLKGGYNVPGVVVPEMDAHVYLALLLAVGVLLAVPALLRGFRPPRSERAAPI
jgi:VWFA-related protein